MHDRTLIVAPEAFTPRVETLCAPAGLTVAGYIAHAVNAGALAFEDVPRVRAFVDGAPLEMLADGLDLRPRADQELSLAVLPQDADGNNTRVFAQILNIVTTIAVTALFGPWAGAAFSAVSTLAVNALFPGERPDSMSGQSDNALTDGSNRPRPREPMPLVLGKQRVAFDLAAKYYTQTVGDDVWLHAIFGIHYGPCVVTEPMIGETPLADYPAADYQVEWFLTPGPRSSTLYPGRVDETGLDDQLDFEGSPWEVHATEADAERIELDFAWPKGLRFNKDNGAILHQAVQIAVEWSPYDTETWTPAPLPPAFSRTGAALPAGSYYLHERSADTVRRSVGWEVPIKGRYKVRCRAWDPDGNDPQRSSTDTYWTALRTIERKAPIKDETLSLLVLKIRQTGDLSGVLPAVTGVVEPIAPIWNGANWNTSAPTSNQAALARWLLMGPAAARPKTADRFHPSFADGYELIEANGWGSGVLVAREMSQEDALGMLARAGRFGLYDNGRQLCLVTDWEKPIARQMFTGRNAEDYRVKAVFPDDCHGVIVEYRNLDQDTKTDELIVYADGYSAEGDAETEPAQLLEALTLDMACTAARAFKEGRAWLARRLLQREAHSWTAAADSIYATWGDRVLVRHAGPLIGLAEARVQARRWSGDGASVIGVRLDVEVEMEAGKAYAIDVRRADKVLRDLEVVTAPGRVRDLTFATPLAPAAAPERGDLIAFGEPGAITEDLELVDIQPAGDGRKRLQAAAYIGEALVAAETGPIPPLQTAISGRKAAPKPRKVGLNASPDGVQLAFDVTVPRGAAVDSFSARWRRSPLDGEEGAWAPLRPLGATERLLVTPAVLQAQGDAADEEAAYKVDIDLVTVMKGGERSKPLEIRGVLVRRPVPVPENLTASAVLLQYEFEDDLPIKTRRTAKPQLAVSVTPVTSGLVADLVVEYRVATTPPGAWRPAGAPLPAANPSGRYTVIGGGSVYDVRAKWRTADGWLSDEWADVFGVVVNGDEVSDDTAAVGTRPADEVLSALDGAVSNAQAATSDSVLTPGEKVILNPQIQAMRNARTALVARATSLGVGTALSAYTTAMDALDAYLATLTSPVAWDNLAGNTAVVGATFVAKVRDAAQRASELNAANDAEAAKRADWGSVGSRPLELTDGRIGAGLDANGDLARNIAVARATASNLLRFTGGGLFTGELSADTTAAHTAAAILGQGTGATANTLAQLEAEAARRVYNARERFDFANGFADWCNNVGGDPATTAAGLVTAGQAGWNLVTVAGVGQVGEFNTYRARRARNAIKVQPGEKYEVTVRVRQTVADARGTAYNRILLGFSGLDENYVYPGGTEYYRTIDVATSGAWLEFTAVVSTAAGPGVDVVVSSAAVKHLRPVVYTNRGPADADPGIGVQQVEWIRTRTIRDLVPGRRLTETLRDDGSTKTTEAAVVTGLGTAAGIVGQGALATKSAVGSVDITTGAVLPGHTQLGDTSNIYPDPEFADLSLYTGDAAATQPTASDGGPSKNQLVLAAAAAQKDTFGPAFPVDGGKSYLASCWMETTGTGSNGAEYYLVWYSDNAATVEISTSARLGVSVSTTPARAPALVTAPAAAKRAKFKFRKPAPSSGAGRSAVYSAPVFRLLTDAELAAQNAFRLGYHLVREDGATPLTDALAVTSQGVAAGFVGQGALATKNKAGSGDILAGALNGTEVSGTAQFTLGSGPNSVTLSGSDLNFVLWAGDPSPASAVTRLWRNGVFETSAFRAMVGGVEYWNSVTGPTAAGAEAFLKYATDAVPYTNTRAQGVTLSASTAAVAEALTAKLGASSTVTVDVSAPLGLTKRTVDDWPAILTVSVHERFRVNEFAAWSAWTQLGTKSLTKITSGTPTAAQYRVYQGSDFVSVPGSPGEFDEVPFWAVDLPASLALSVAAVSKAEGLYEYAVVANATFLPKATVTLTDTDGAPSYVRADVNSSGSVSFSLPDGYKNRLRVDSTGATTVAVTANAVVVVTNSGLMRTVRNFNAVASLTVAGVGGLDTGVKAANTWYHLWAISNGTVDNLLFSLSATAPTMPAGYSHKTRLGAVRTDAAGNIIPFKQRGAKTRITGAGNMPVMASGWVGDITNAGWEPIPVANFVPPTAIEITVRARAGNNGSGVVIVNPSTSFGGWNVANGPYFMIDNDNSIHPVDILLEGPNLYWASNTTNASVRCVGWTDEI